MLYRAMLVLCCSLSLPLAAQTPQSAAREPETIRIGTALVMLDVGVFDRKGQPQSALAHADFAVYEDGQLQQIAFFGRTDLPISFGLLIDRSQSMGDSGKLEKAKAVLQAFLRAGNPQNEAFCLAFNEERGLLTDFSADLTGLAEKLDRLWAEGGTALYEAIDAGLAQLQRGKHQRRALLVVTDGGDQHSRLSLEALLKRAQQSSAQIYLVGFFSPYEIEVYQSGGAKIELTDGQKVDNPRYVFRTLAEETGAETFFPRSAQELEQTIANIAASLRRQYTIGYYPTNEATDDRYRRLTVKLNGKQHGQLLLKTRRGYRLSQSAEAASAATDKTAAPPAASTTPPRAVIADLPAPPLFRETFDQSASSWPQTADAFAKKGKYYLRGQQIVPAPPFVYADFEASVELFFPVPPDNAGQRSFGTPGAGVSDTGTLHAAGLTFRVNEGGYYTVLIAPLPGRREGYFKLSKIARGEQQDVLSWKRDGAIAERTILKVRCRGAQIEIFANELRIAVIRDTAHAKGRLSLVAAGEAVFDNLTLRKLE